MEKYFGQKILEVDRQLRLKWIVEQLLVLDLDTISYVKRLQFIEDMTQFLFSASLEELNPKEVKAYEKFIEPKRGKSMRVKNGKINPPIGDFFADNIISLEELSSDKFWHKVKDVKEVIVELYSKYITPFTSSEDEKIFLQDKAKYYLENVKGTLEIKFRLKAEEEYYEQYPLKNPKEASSIYFFDIIRNAQISRIRKCQECEKVFVQLKGKDREYCCDKHMYRYLQRQRRARLKKKTAEKKKNK